MLSEELEVLAEKERVAQHSCKNHIRVCQGTGCMAARALEVKNAISGSVKEMGLDKDIAVIGVGCRGLCALGPLVTIEPGDRLYKEAVPEDAGEIVASVTTENVERLHTDTKAPFFVRQEKIALENAGSIDPDRIEPYLAIGGYQSLLKVLSEMTPAGVLDTITRAGLRGRGGAGYPTGLKWSTVAKAAGPQKYVICNGDEGDPGAFMDRSIMEGDPHRIIEGMAIAGYAVGADRGFLYVRAEYPLAVKRLKTAISRAERNGLLGANIAGTPFSFSLEIRLGAGAFVCGEETALITSIEGNRGMPRPRPPYPAMSGLNSCPTLINNVETFANISPIIRNGAEWYAAIGTEKSKGTKVFCLTGAITNTGLIEVPMGITLREIVFEIGGGIPNGKKLKAIQTGGPSGGCIPPQFLDMKVDYESLREVGSIMGSGGMIIIDETSCMVDVAKFFMEFCRTESCGKCTPCRVGTAEMHGLLDKITKGQATVADIALLEELCEMVRDTSLCGLGQSAPNPVISTLRYFRDEYMAHLEGRCPAGVCKFQATEGVAQNA